MSRGIDRGVRGVFTGWVTGALSRAAQRTLAIDVDHERLLGQPRVVLQLQRDAPSKIRSERAAISMLGTEALSLGGEVLATAFSILAWAPTSPPDEAELARIRLGMGAAYLLAKLAKDAGKSEQYAMDGIQHALIGTLWNGNDIEQISKRAVALVWGGNEAAARGPAPGAPSPLTSACDRLLGAQFSKVVFLLDAGDWIPGDAAPLAERRRALIKLCEDRGTLDKLESALRSTAPHLFAVAR